MSPGAVTIRGATLEDAPALKRLAGELGYDRASAEMRRRLERLLGDPRHHVAVAEGGGLLGWVHVEHRSSLEGGERAELMGLVITAPVRRQGIGRKLVEAAEHWARDRGLAELTVRSNTARRGAHPFYEAMGYAAVKTQHVYAKKLGTLPKEV